jgi:hypothetical protein
VCRKTDNSRCEASLTGSETIRLYQFEVGEKREKERLGRRLVETKNLLRLVDPLSLDLRWRETKYRECRVQGAYSTMTICTVLLKLNVFAPKNGISKGNGQITTTFTAFPGASQML